MGSTSKTPGLLYAGSKISRPDILKEKTFFEWYDEEHIPELVQTSGFDSAFRFIDSDPGSEWPYLAVYPTKDFSFFKSDAFKGMKSLQSDKLPGTGAAAEVMDSVSRFDQLVQVYDPTKKGPGKFGPTKFPLDKGYQPSGDANTRKGIPSASSPRR